MISRDCTFKTFIIRCDIDISLTIQYHHTIFNNTAFLRSNLILLNLALSALEISLMNSKLPLYEEVKVAVRSILYSFLISNDMI